MATPANLTYSALEVRVMNSLRLSTGNATEQTKVQNLINQCYRDIGAKRDWWFLQKRTVINTTSMISGGTVNVTNGSTGVVFSSALTLNNLVGASFFIPGDSNDSLAVYKIGSSAGGTYSLDAAFTGTTSTAASYRVSQDTFVLPADTNKVLNVKRFGFPLPLKRVGIEEMSAYKLTDQTSNKPQAYSVFDEVTTGDPTTQRLLQVHPYPDRTSRLEIFYKQMLNTELTGTTRPLIPDDYIEVLFYAALAEGYAIFLADMERSQYFRQKFNDVLALMSAQQTDYAHDFSGVAPENFYRRKSRRTRGGAGTTLGGLFDYFPMNIP